MCWVSQVMWLQHGTVLFSSSQAAIALHFFWAKALGVINCWIFTADNHVLSTVPASPLTETIICRQHSQTPCNYDWQKVSAPPRGTQKSKGERTIYMATESQRGTQEVALKSFWTHLTLLCGNENLFLRRRIDMGGYNEVSESYLLLVQVLKVFLGSPWLAELQTPDPIPCFFATILCLSFRWKHFSEALSTENADVHLTTASFDSMFLASLRC